ncbi:MAG: glycosyltransferase, partial [Actinomycetota bacterium]|nr:glycosyltransferase [Actinomycetota bacterium]
MTRVSVDVVVPTVGRASLAALLDALAAQAPELPGRVIVVEDGDARSSLARDAVPGPLLAHTEILRGARRGPAAARNIGWRASNAEWISFLDDDVVPDRDWLERLVEDLAGLSPRVAGSQGRVRVPLPDDRRPTDWERNVAGLETAVWATADMAFRREALTAVGGFDERFRRAFREDADIALRLQDAGLELVRGSRSITHPVRPARMLETVRLQAGNADDVVMSALHGREWHARAAAPRGRRRRHLVTTAAGLTALAALALRRRRIAAAAATIWLSETAQFAWTRVAPGPRTAREVATVVATSVLIPPAAAYYWTAGHLRARRLLRDAARAPQRGAPPSVSSSARNGRPEA